MSTYIQIDLGSIASALSHVASYCEQTLVNVSMCVSHGILNWVMSVGSLICKLVCIFNELSLLAIPTHVTCNIAVSIIDKYMSSRRNQKMN